MCMQRWRWAHLLPEQSPNLEGWAMPVPVLYSINKFHIQFLVFEEGTCSPTVMLCMTLSGFSAVLVISCVRGA